MASARLYLKNFHPRVFTLPSKVMYSTKQSWESEIRWFSTPPTVTDKASVDGKSNGREVAVSEVGGRSKPSLRKRQGPWSNRRGLVPFRLPDFFPRTGFGNALMQVPENLNKILENLAPSHLFGRVKDDKCYKLRFEVPGLSKEDIKITIVDGFLIINGENKEEEEGSDDDDQWSFKSYGYYNTSLLLPDDAKIGEIKAELKDGILSLTIPKSENQRKEVKEVKMSPDHLPPGGRDFLPPAFSLVHLTAPAT